MLVTLYSLEQFIIIRLRGFLLAYFFFTQSLCLSVFVSVSLSLSLSINQSIFNLNYLSMHFNHPPSMSIFQILSLCLFLNLSHTLKHFVRLHTACAIKICLPVPHCVNFFIHLSYTHLVLFTYTDWIKAGSSYSLEFKIFPSLTDLHCIYSCCQYTQVKRYQIIYPYSFLSINISGVKLYIYIYIFNYLFPSIYIYIYSFTYHCRSSRFYLPPSHTFV